MFLWISRGLLTLEHGIARECTVRPVCVQAEYCNSSLCWRAGRRGHLLCAHRRLRGDICLLGVAPEQATAIDDHGSIWNAPVIDVWFGEDHWGGSIPSPTSVGQRRDRNQGPDFRMEQNQRLPQSIGTSVHVRHYFSRGASRLLNRCCSERPRSATAGGSRLGSSDAIGARVRMFFPGDGSSPIALLPDWACPRSCRGQT